MKNRILYQSLLFICLIFLDWYPNYSENDLEFCYEPSKRINKSKLHAFPYISTDTFIGLADHSYDFYNRNFFPEKVRCNDIVYVTSHFVDRFFKEYHPKIMSPYILITHQGDPSVGYEHQMKHLEDGKIIAWYGQNIVGM